jgi:hypothetical protein
MQKQTLPIRGAKPWQSKANACPIDLSFLEKDGVRMLAVRISDQVCAAG